MNEFSRGLIERSGYERDGFAAHYDDFRPKPPRILLDVLCREARTERPQLVVDLGCGTGLSTRAWADIAERVVGVEPNPAMIAEARVRTNEPNIQFVESFSHDTGLPDEIADLVTCSQSLHWMEPQPTFAEAARVLRNGGVFAAYDYDAMPVIDPEIEEAWWAYAGRRREVRKRHGLQAGADRWEKDGHLERLRESGRFRFCRELVFHSETQGGVDELVGFALSMGMLAQYEHELGLDELEAVARRVLGERRVPIVFGYRVRLGIK